MNKKLQKLKRRTQKHLQRTCSLKQLNGNVFETKEQALNYVRNWRRYKKELPTNVIPYNCLVCNKWHVGNWRSYGLKDALRQIQKEKN